MCKSECISKQAEASKIYAVGYHKHDKMVHYINDYFISFLPLSVSSPSFPEIQKVNTNSIIYIKDVPGGLPKSDLLGVTVALIHVVL